MRKFKIFLFSVWIFFMISMFASCTKEKNIVNGERAAIKVVATTFPIYDITSTLSKGIDSIDTILLMDNGIDLHNFSPSSKDLSTISNSDLFIYIGGESDEWVDEAFQSLNISTDKQLNLMSNLKAALKEEELKEGMEEEEEEGEGEGEEEIEYDEHIWLSLKNAKEIAKSIKTELEKICDSSAATIIGTNYEEFIKDIDLLDRQYKEMVDKAKNDGRGTTLIFADRFPFRYMIDDYGLDYFAAFKGCSAESEASFKTIKFLADKVSELEVNSIFVIDDSDKKIAHTVIETSGKNDTSILTLDSMQSKTIKDVQDGDSYIKIMMKNLSVLKEYFN